MLLEDWNAAGGGGTEVYQVHGICKTHLGSIPRSQWELPISQNYDDVCKESWSEGSVTFTVSHRDFEREYTFNLSDKCETSTVLYLLIPIALTIIAAVAVAIVVVRKKNKKIQ